MTPLALRLRQNPPQADATPPTSDDAQPPSVAYPLSIIHVTSAHSAKPFICGRRWPHLLQETGITYRQRRGVRAGYGDLGCSAAFSVTDPEQPRAAGGVGATIPLPWEVVCTGSCQ